MLIQTAAAEQEKKKSLLSRELLSALIPAVGTGGALHRRLATGGEVVTKTLDFVGEGSVGSADFI